MHIHKALEIVENDVRHIKWRKKFPNAYLSYGFLTFSGENRDWQIGYYDEKSDKISSFQIRDGKLENTMQDEILKHSGAKVLALDVSKVKIDLDKALELFDKFQKKKYPNEFASKFIIILQNGEDHGLVWNITIVSSNFNTLNVKINAVDGKVIHHNLTSLLNYKSKELF